MTRWALGLVLATSLVGCSTGTSQLQNVCRDLSTEQAALPHYDPARPITALQLGLARFTLVDRAVATIGEAGVPGGASGALERSWLAPARVSLASWSTRLAVLRTATQGADRTAVDTALGPVLALGTAGVDTRLLRTQGLTACAVAFTPPAG